MVNISGWAFSKDSNEKSAAIKARYAEIKHLAKPEHMSYTGRAGYAKNSFSGKLISEEAKQLSSLDIAIIMDSGNLCFGGECSKSGDSFSGCYYTD